MQPRSDHFAPEIVLGGAENQADHPRLSRRAWARLPLAFTWLIVRRSPLSLNRLFLTAVVAARCAAREGRTARCEGGATVIEVAGVRSAAASDADSIASELTGAAAFGVRAAGLAADLPADVPTDLPVGLPVGLPADSPVGRGADFFAGFPRDFSVRALAAFFADALEPRLDFAGAAAAPARVSRWARRSVKSFAFSLLRPLASTARLPNVS
jgi:hypothetical protein